MGCGCGTRVPEGEIPAAKGGCGCGEACSCSGPGSGTKPCRCPPLHPSGAGNVITPDTARSELFRRPPPIAVPPQSLIRCQPPHEELRPPGSFLDCDVFAALYWGTARGGGRLAEPPQALEPEAETAYFPDGWPHWPLLPEAQPTSEVETADDGVVQCTSTAKLAKFSVVTICRDSGHELDLGAQSFPTPVRPDPRGKGGAGELCKCQCNCLPPDVREPPGEKNPTAVDVEVPNGAPDMNPYGEGYRFPPNFRPPPVPTRIFGGDPDQPGPHGPSIPRDPLPPGAPTSAVSLGGQEPNGSSIDQPGYPFPLRPSPPRPGAVDAAPAGPARDEDGLEDVRRARVVVSRDAPAENVFPETCPYCGLVRGASEEEPASPARAPRGSAAPVAAMEPPQVLSPAPSRSPPPQLAVLSLGTLAMPAVQPPLHPDGGDHGALVIADAIQPTPPGSHP